MSIFQFHKGTIWTWSRYIHIHNFRYFNSIKVQLEPYVDLASWLSLMNFNSIKVQLERLDDGCCRLLLPHFNSIKVQLEHLSHRNLFTAKVFQFHKGTIRTFDVIKLILEFAHFNSIKVQLEQTRIYWGRWKTIISIP